MSIHPLSVCSQLELLFDDVDRARFEYDGYVLVYRIAMSDGSSGHVRPELVAYVEENRAMGTPAEVREWQDGPRHPYASFTRDQLAVLEASDPTSNGLTACVVQGLDYVAACESETPAPGRVKLQVTSGNENLSPEQLSEVSRFGAAILGLPDANVIAEQGSLSPVEDSGKNLPFLVHQASRAGITDRVLLHAVEKDEDEYRALRRRGFPEKEKFGHPPSALVPDTKVCDLRTLFPLYDRIFFPVEQVPSDRLAWGMSWKDSIELVREGRLVPVFSNRLGEYDGALARELMEAAPKVVMPRELSALSAATMLDTNPLWRLAQTDAKLARAIAKTMRREATSLPDENMRKLVSLWLDFQNDGLINFSSGAISQGALLPMSFGPGALVANILRSSGRDKVADLEAMFAGLQIVQASSLGATCVPPANRGMYMLSELCAAMMGAKVAESSADALSALPFVAELDRILDAAQITIPKDVPVSVWIEQVAPFTRDLRAGLADVFRAEGTASREDVEQRAIELEWNLANVEARRNSLAQVVERFDVLGLASDGLAGLLGLDFPFAGWAIGPILKYGAPWVWDRLGRDSHTTAARDVLDANAMRTNVGTIRIHRVSQALRKKPAGG